MANMRNQAERFESVLIPDDIVEMNLVGPVKTVVDGSGNSHRSRTIILAMGSGYRRLGLPGEDRLSGHGVSWCATCDGFFFRGQTIAVVGGGDSALEEATFLSRFAEKVYVVHRRDTLRASKTMQERAFADPKLEFVWNNGVVDMHGQHQLEGLTLRGTVDGEESHLAVSGLFVAIGHDPRSTLVANQVDLTDDGLRPSGGSIHANKPRRRLRLRRPRRFALPAGNHCRRLGVPGRSRCRTLPCTRAGLSRSGSCLAAMQPQSFGSLLQEAASERVEAMRIRPIVMSRAKARGAY